MSATKRGSNYSQEEITFLLATVRKHLPIGQEEWKIVAQEHSEQFPLAERCFTSLRKKFNSFANARMPTGQPHCPPHIIEAKRILEAIKDEADIETFNNAVIAQVPAENNETENAGAAADVPVDAIDIPEEQSNTSSSSSSSTAPSAPAPGISPRLQRISTPRKKSSPEEMSVQDFFNFSILQREEDRKDRIQREEVRERERQEDSRMFRNMFMAVIMQGNNGNAPEGKAGNEEK